MQVLPSQIHKNNNEQESRVAVEEISLNSGSLIKTVALKQRTELAGCRLTSVRVQLHRQKDPEAVANRQDQL